MISNFNPVTSKVNDLMERVGTLIKRLTELYEQNSSAEKLSATAQMLVAELRHSMVTHSSSAYKVSVVLPNILQQETVEEPAGNAIVAEENKVMPPETVSPVESFLKIKSGWHFDPVHDIPTLAHQQKNTNEVNEVMAPKQESLNDRLNATRQELGSMLKDVPVRDLKKAIGINDRFVFINELFRGDESMYERSIKTINAFTMLPEAEYWINRELKIKMGWDEQSDTVKNFDQLIRRRFS